MDRLDVAAELLRELRQERAVLEEVEELVARDGLERKYFDSVLNILHTAFFSTLSIVFQLRYARHVF